ncbi:MAG: phosphoenolpyruvate--protein phosphotransferase [Pyrinomonadaceae bacterium]
MKPDKKKSQKSHLVNHSEKRIQARAVSRGIAVGNVVCLHGKKRQFYRVNLQNEKIEGELLRFRAAVRLARRRLKKLISQKDVSDTQRHIFESHDLILEDSALQKKIESIIVQEKVNAEWAVKLVTDNYLAVYDEIRDEHLRERRIDLEDVTERLQTALGGGGSKTVELAEGSIIVAREVNPSTLVELSQSNLTGIITERGGWTSHTFILSRELNLPAVTGSKGILRRVETGDKIIVDGFHGQIVLNPLEKSLQEYKINADKFREIKINNTDNLNGTAQTLDRKTINLYANLDFSKDYTLAKKYGAAGVGLFRSEFLFNQNQGYPTENEQVEAYKKIAAFAGNKVVKIRTFDLNVDQISHQTEEVEKNPALGLRAIRLSLTNDKQFRIQLRSLLRASFKNNLDIVLPMISDISEIRRAKAILEEEKKRLELKKIQVGNPKIGVMVEVPSAVMMIEEIAAEVDFINLGTNDLVQYLLAVDRDNESVADWFRTLHPAVLKAVKKVIQAAEKFEKPLIICGEMAGSPVYVPILIGFGALNLSMNINSIPRIKNVISNIAFEEAREVSKLLETCLTAQEVEEKMQSELSAKWSHLFPPEIFPPKNQ